MRATAPWSSAPPTGNTPAPPASWAPRWRWLRPPPSAGFAFPAEAVTRALAAAPTRVLFLCHPNNPTGQLLPLARLAAWSKAHPHTLFVVDESYLPFAEAAPSALDLHRTNILVIRSMTKAYGLAGLRLGYAVGAAPIIDALRRAQPPWSVNAPAQAAGRAALAQTAALAPTLHQLRQHARDLQTALRAQGWRPLPSDVHFFLLPVDDARAVRAALLPRGLIVRDATSFGLPGHIRIAARTPAENQRLAAALGELLPHAR